MKKSTVTIKKILTLCIHIISKVVNWVPIRKSRLKHPIQMNPLIKLYQAQIAQAILTMIMNINRITASELLVDFKRAIRCSFQAAVRRIKVLSRSAASIA